MFLATRFRPIAANVVNQGHVLSIASAESACPSDEGSTSSPSTRLTSTEVTRRRLSVRRRLVRCDRASKVASDPADARWPRPRSNPLDSPGKLVDRSSRERAHLDRRPPRFVDVLCCAVPGLMMIFAVWDAFCCAGMAKWFSRGRTTQIRCPKSVPANELRRPAIIEGSGMRDSRAECRADGTSGAGCPASKAL
jgi:hypothetical protein